MTHFSEYDTTPSEGEQIQIPSNIEPRTIAYLGRVGMQFGRVIADAKLVNVSLPAGWRRLERVTAAVNTTRFIDRTNHIRAEMESYGGHLSFQICCRYRLKQESDPNIERPAQRMLVMDGDEVLFRTPWHPYYLANQESYSASNFAAGKQARNWLYEHHPNWEDPTAYWEDIDTLPA